MDVESYTVHKETFQKKTECEKTSGPKKKVKTVGKKKKTLLVEKQKAPLSSYLLWMVMRERTRSKRRGHKLEQNTTENPKTRPEEEPWQTRSCYRRCGPILTPRLGRNTKHGAGRTGRNTRWNTESGSRRVEKLLWNRPSRTGRQRRESR